MSYLPGLSGLSSSPHLSSKSSSASDPLSPFSGRTLSSQSSISPSSRSPSPPPLSLETPPAFLSQPSIAPSVGGGMMPPASLSASSHPASHPASHPDLLRYRDSAIPEQFGLSYASRAPGSNYSFSSAKYPFTGPPPPPPRSRSRTPSPPLIGPSMDSMRSNGFHSSAARSASNLSSLATRVECHDPRLDSRMDSPLHLQYAQQQPHLQNVHHYLPDYNNQRLRFLSMIHTRS